MYEMGRPPLSYSAIQRESSESGGMAENNDKVISNTLEDPILGKMIKKDNYAGLSNGS